MWMCWRLCAECLMTMQVTDCADDTLMIIVLCAALTYWGVEWSCAGVLMSSQLCWCVDVRFQNSINFCSVDESGRCKVFSARKKSSNSAMHDCRTTADVLADWWLDVTDGSLRMETCRKQICDQHLSTKRENQSSLAPAWDLRSRPSSLCKSAVELQCFKTEKTPSDPKFSRYGRTSLDGLKS